MGGEQASHALILKSNINFSDGLLEASLGLEGTFLSTLVHPALPRLPGWECV